MSTISTEAVVALVKSFEETTVSRMPSDQKAGEREAHAYNVVLTELGTEPQTENSPLPAERASIAVGEQPAALFQPDAVLVTQFFEDRRCKTTLEPEKRLMLAVLEDALCNFQENYSARYGKRKQLFDDALRWFFEASDDWVFGFENICSVLEFNPEYIRKGLVRWKEKELSKHHSAMLLR
ncbi:MAG: hypothetical protein ACM3SP_14765 [Chloroflexota bacterium]